MNDLLMFFAIPFAVVVISIVLEKLIKCPYLVAAIIFSIFLVIGIATSNTTLLIAGVVYMVISFVAAYLTMVICKILKNNRYNISSVLNTNNLNGTQVFDTNNVFTTNENLNNTRNRRPFCNRNR